MLNKILEAKDLSKLYSENQERGVQSASLSLKKGEVVCIVGPSGSGKSTLLRLLATLEESTQGSVSKSASLSKAGSLIYVPQDYALWPHLTVLQNLTLVPHELKRDTVHNIESHAEELLERFGLAEYRGESVHNLSGGQKQRVALIRAIIMKPEVLLLDEVTSALDPELTKSVLDMIRTLAKDGNTMLVVTHHMSLALSIADRIIFMDKGKILRDEPSFSFFYEQEDKRIIDFIASSSHKDSTVEVYRGFDQFQAFQLGTLNSSKPGSWKNVMGSIGDRWFECMGDLYPQYEEERIKKKIGWRMLQYSESPLDKDLRKRHPELNEYRLLPKTLGNPANYYVLNDTVVIQMYGGEGDEPTVIEIKNENVAKSYQNYFDLLWEQSKPVK